VKIPGRLADLVSSTRRRLKRMTAEDMVLWADVAGSEMSRAFRSYARDRAPESLAEVERGLGILVAMVEELRSRS
jgi:hypothetical protein